MTDLNLLKNNNMDLVNYTKEFNYTSDHRVRMIKDKYANKLDRWTDKRDNAIDKGEYAELSKGLFHRLRARRAYRRADKFNRKIQAANRSINRAVNRANIHRQDRSSDNYED